MALTKRQYEVLSFLDSFIKQNGYCPSFQEIGKGLNLSSLATVHKHVKTLEAKGFIHRGFNQSRSIEVVFALEMGGSGRKGQEVSHLEPESSQNRIEGWELPLFGRIAAGLPLEAVTNNEGLSLEEFVGKKDVFTLRVKGDSMVEDHICDDDYVIIERTETAVEGDTIVALIDNSEATLKRFYREPDGRIRLQPANPGMQPIFVKEESLKIQGRVIGVLRKY
ncbi:MAG TPA: transcriptional repressor LexA [Terriglobia bacterium]|nr:transcriptional repressor LexA [Terriglobia bacterium]